MRLSVEFEAYGQTMDKIISDANRQWKEFTNDDNAVLPHDTEIHVEQHATTDFKGIVHARIKVETNDCEEDDHVASENA